MELSNTYTLKFDRFSKKYVVVKKNEDVETQQAFVQEEAPRVVPANDTQPVPNVTPPRDKAPVNPPRLTPQSPIELPQEVRSNPSLDSGEEAVGLACELYNNSRVLHMMYQSLRDTSRRNAATINGLISENLIVQQALLNIYYELSGSNRPPQQNLIMPIMGNNFCSGLGVTSAYLQVMIGRALSLQRLVNVDNINRQLIIINSSLQNQKSTIDGLRASC